VQAAYNLGVLYESNFIGPIDTQKAAEWYKVAAKAGHTGARDALARLGSGNAAADSGDQAQTLADKVEPAAGSDEETGEGDSSPRAKSAHNGPKTLLADIQRILIKQGVLPGKADGVLSQQTEDSIRAAQKKFGLTEDGQPSQDLLEKLLQAPPTGADKQFP
jgi:peptidoglycan hydrolase-like protein with peptidoglycan-binding domain